MKKVLVGGIAVVTIGAIVVACGGGGDKSIDIAQGTVLRNVTVVNTRDGSLKSGMQIIIDGGKIIQITDATAINTSGTAQSVDGTGKFVVPGFLDMHTHALGTLGTAPSDFPALLANGVTGVREAGGSVALLQTAKTRNAAVVAGTLDSPEVVFMPSSGTLPTAVSGVAQFVKDRKAEGADYIKTTSGGRDVMLAVMAEAKAQGFHSAGHLVTAASALESSNAGYHSYEHLGAGMGLIMDCASDEANIRAAVLANPAPPPANVVNPRLYDGNQYAQFYQRIMDTYSEAKCVSLAQAFVKNDTWQTVTLIRLRTSDFGEAQAYRTDPNLKYVDKTRRALWESIAQQYETVVTPASRAIIQQYYALSLKVVKLLKQNGVKILAGSDLGGGLVIPGFSLHQEFRELAAAGLTPLEVLQTTTLNGAQFIGREATMGTVEVGKNADLVLLDANPIADVANLDKIASLFLRGKFYSRAALDKLLSDTAATYAAGTLNDLHTALDPTHVE